jgi:hypothetical protein
MAAKKKNIKSSEGKNFFISNAERLVRCTWPLVQSISVHLNAFRAFFCQLKIGR